MRHRQRPSADSHRLAHSGSIAPQAAALHKAFRRQAQSTGHARALNYYKNGGLLIGSRRYYSSDLVHRCEIHYWSPFGRRKFTIQRPHALQHSFILPRRLWSSFRTSIEQQHGEFCGKRSRRRFYPLVQSPPSLTMSRMTPPKLNLLRLYLWWRA